MRGRMNDPMHLLIIGSALGAMMVAGCTSSGTDPLAGPRTVSLAEFADPQRSGDEPSSANATVEHEADANGRTPPANPPRLGAGSPDVDEATLERLQREMREATSPRATVPGQPVLVDSLVGQINGRPIYADDILLPLEDQLIAVRQRAVSADQFAQQALVIIQERLRTVVTNELILSEAETSLTTEQRQGLIYYLTQLREEEVAKRGGSQVGAQQQLLEAEGMSLEDYLERRKDEELIRSILVSKILSRVVVSWHDIEREYERRFAEFNPPARITLSRIRIANDEAELIADVKRRLAEGEPFASVAAAAGMSNAGRWDTFATGPGGISDIPINDAYKPYLEGMRQGDTTEAFDAGGRTMWLHVTEVVQPEGRSLYDPEVQELLSGQLRQQRFIEEQNRYLQSLLENSTMDDINEMTVRLLDIALLRYGG